MKRFFLLVLILLFAGQIDVNAQIRPFIGLEGNQSFFKFSDFVKKKNSIQKPIMGDGLGPIIGLTYDSINNQNILPYFKTGFIFQSGKNKDTLINSIIYNYKLRYKFIPLYFGSYLWIIKRNKLPGFGFIGEVGLDNLISNEKIKSLLINEKNYSLSFGYAVGLTIIAHGCTSELIYSRKNNYNFIQYSIKVRIL